MCENGIMSFKTIFRPSGDNNDGVLLTDPGDETLKNLELHSKFTVFLY